MIHPTGPAASALLVHAVALYLPLLATVALALGRRPGRARVAGALVATAWNVPALLGLNVIAVRFGWWDFGAGSAMVAGIPADMWLGWALLWGAVPMLATTDRLVLAGTVLFVIDLVLMPAAEPVLVLGPHWLVGETLALATCLTPGLLLGRWTVTNQYVGRRAVLQVMAFGGILLFVIPTLVFTVTDESWAPLLQRPRWQIVAAALALAPAGAAAIQAVREFAIHGGTPVPLDPPTSLVASGPYAYVANPMQLGATVILAAWGVLLDSPAVVAAAAGAVAFSSGLAAWNENDQLTARFGDDWRRYRQQVRSWVPRWRPAVISPATVYVDASCTPCTSVGAFIGRRHPAGLAIEPAERSPEPLRRITYVSSGTRAAGIAAIGRSLEHVNLAWAAASWLARLPVVRPLLQLVTDAVGGGPRATVSPDLDVRGRQPSDRSCHPLLGGDPPADEPHAYRAGGQDHATQPGRT